MNDSPMMKLAVFRYGIISDFLSRNYLDYGEKEKLLIEKSLKMFKNPITGKDETYAKSTIKQWIKQYKDGGSSIEALFPKPRKDRGKIRSIDLNLQNNIIQYKIANPNDKAPAIIEKLKRDKIISYEENIRPCTIYRLFKKNIDLIQKNPNEKDRRKFEAEFVNDLWQSDVMHAISVIDGSRMKKTYLHAIIDDHSRVIIHAEFFMDEKIETYKLCLKKGLEKRGLPRKLYVDNGACFSAINLEQITACLGISICHTPPYTPQGRGKIERWFKTIRESFMPLLKERSTLTEINNELNLWIDKYHNKIHSSLGVSPLEKYAAKCECIRPAPPKLMDYFRILENRKVNKDRTFRLNNILFEAPTSLIDKKVTLKFHFEKPYEVEIFFNDQTFGMAKKLNIYENKLNKRHYDTKDIKSGEVFKGTRDEGL